MARRDTKLQAEGAEFLVLGELLLRGIPAYKAYGYMPGYDLVATSPHRTARIQVKSRFHTGASAFFIDRFDTDFVVAAFLNRGRAKDATDVRAPEYFVFPASVVRRQVARSKGPKFYVHRLGTRERYRDAWPLIQEFLEG